MPRAAKIQIPSHLADIAKTYENLWFLLILAGWRLDNAYFGGLNAGCLDGSLVAGCWLAGCWLAGWLAGRETPDPAPHLVGGNRQGLGG